MKTRRKMKETARPDVEGPTESVPEEPPPDKKEEDKPLASIREVLSFGRCRKKRICFVVGFSCCCVSGCVFPVMAFLFARSFQDLVGVVSGDDFLAQVRELAYSFMVLGAVAFASMAGQATLLETSAGIMTHDLKITWFDALLRQDLAYYDIKDISGSASIISQNGARYKKGLGRKLGNGFQFAITAMGGLAYAFWASWQVSLVLLTTVPVFGFCTFFLVKINQSQSARASAGYAEAGSIVQTSVSSIRTILSLNAVQIIIDRFVSATEKSYQEGIRLLKWIGLANGMMMSSMVLGYMVIALYGAFVIYDKVRNTGCDASGSLASNTACDPDGADVVGSLMGITFVAAVLPQVSVGVEAFTDARAACYPAIQVINRRVGDEDVRDTAKGPIRRGSSSAPLPKYIIDSSTKNGVELDSVEGCIEFKNVTFAYPTRQETKVFDGFSLKIEAGKTVALVGPSGCGKSTTVQLVERFYDPVAGAVKLDGYDLRHLNVHWLRQQIGLVSQEPVLFACSIRENIAYGSPNATQEQIEEAAKMANAHDFIVSFPDGYSTQVGDKGAQLSGGQKQRIALTRVLVRNPKILLLDESTSALDSESEQVVQEALEKVVGDQRRTTIVIAHRLSTIRNADMIAVVNAGRIVEQGTHDELISLEGQYYQLVEAQKTTCSEDESSRRKSEFVDLRSTEAMNGAPALLFRDVYFRYPARRNIEVFKGLNLSVRTGETLALVGPSGHGKSTTIQLIERFYDPDSGSVELDGLDLKELNVHWLREQFGLVSQEPLLFDTTIFENIRFGFPDASQEQVESAAALANAHNFIVDFPDGYETQVGEGGTQVSGGQKQRIALARALLRRPRFLLLDEATSALDTESERVVQEALDKVMANKWLTTIVIAHRLSTIRNADRIAVISDGKVREIGTHDELMSKPDGHYRRLNAFQNHEGDISLASALSKTADTAQAADQKKREGDDVTLEGEIDKETAKRHAQRARLLAREDTPLFVIGALGALLTGLMLPGWGIAFAYVIELLYTPVRSCDDPDLPPCPPDYYDIVADDMRDMSFKIAWGLLGIMVISLVGSILLFYAFGKASERILKRVRDASFGSLMRQEVGYFDMRPVGNITSQLQEDAAMLHSFSGEPIRTLVTGLSSVLVGVAISFFFMWPFALLCLALVPFLGFGAEMEMKLYLGEDEGGAGEPGQHSAGGIVVESLVNIRTVASLTIEDRRSAEFSQALDDEDPTPIKTNFIKGSATGLGQFIQMWGIALMFWWGGWLLLNYPETFSYRDFLFSLNSLLFGLEGIGLAVQGATDREKAKLAAKRIFELADRQSAIDPLSEEGVKNIPPPEVNRRRRSSRDSLASTHQSNELQRIRYEEEYERSRDENVEGHHDGLKHEHKRRHHHHRHHHHHHDDERDGDMRTGEGKHHNGDKHRKHKHQKKHRHEHDKLPEV